MKKLFFLALLLSVVFYISSCYKDNLAELTPSAGFSGNACDTSVTISYAAQVVPILQNNCGVNNSCHSSVNNSGYDLSTYSGVNSVAASGNLVSAITWDGSVTPMPEQGSQMDGCNIAVIIKWVNAGHLNN